MTGIPTKKRIDSLILRRTQINLVSLIAAVSFSDICDARTLEALNKSDLNQYQQEIEESTNDHVIQEMIKQYDLERIKSYVSAQELDVRGKHDGGLSRRLFEVVNNRALPDSLRDLALDVMSCSDDDTGSNLLKFAEDESNPTALRGRSTSVLGRCDSKTFKTYSPGLLELINKRKELPLVYSAISAFGNKDISNAVDVLLRCVSDDDQIIRLRAISVFGSSDYPNMEHKSDARIVRALKRQLTSTDELTSAAAVEALGHLKAVDAVPDFLTLAMASDTPYHVKWVIDRALVAIPGRQAEDALILILDNPDDVTALEATESLAKRGSREALPKIKNRLNRVQKSNHYTRQQMMRAIDNLENK